ncbi:PEGA domain-containing protein [bacterium]|nr:PEGA domain-containing protein [bacterium]
MPLSQEELNKIRQEVRTELETEIKKGNFDPNSEETQKQNIVKDKETIKDKVRQSIIEEEKRRLRLLAQGMVEYQNRDGEIDLITPESAHARELETEIYEQALKKENLQKTIPVWVVTILALIIVGLYFLPSPKNQVQPRLKIESNIEDAEVYIDGQLTTYRTPCTLSNIAIGNHTISLEKDGYISKNKFQEVFIDSTKFVSLFFNLVENAEFGYLDVKANIDGVNILIDDKYIEEIANEGKIKVTVGTKKVSVERAGYNAFPSFQNIEISKNEESKVYFNLTRTDVKKIIRRELKVTANIEGGEILINGKSTGKFANYIFTDLEAGVYSVTVRKKGYEEPNPKSVTFSTTTDKIAELSFELKEIYIAGIEISTEPVQGEIFIDGISKGFGKVKTTLNTIGEVEIRFGNVEGYLTPKNEKLLFGGENELLKIIGTYEPLIKISAALDASQTVQIKDCKVDVGYFINSENNFIEVPNPPGVIIRRSDIQKFYHWELGHDNLGNPAIQLSFTLPENYNFKKGFKLYLWAYSSNDNYPLTFVNNSTLAIFINSRYVREKYEPKYNVSKDTRLGFDEIDVSSFVKAGENKLIIRTTEETTNYLLIRRIELTNEAR